MNGSEAAWSWLRPVPGASPSRYVVDLESYFDETQDSPEFSPDGTTLAYGTLSNDLVLRHEASRELTVVPGLKDAWSPFYSPDGKSIAYVAGFPGDLKVVDLGTMAVRTLVPDSAVAYGGSWSDDGWIYYTAELGAALWRVRADRMHHRKPSDWCGCRRSVRSRTDWPRSAERSWRCAGRSRRRRCGMSSSPNERLRRFPGSKT